MNLIEILLTEFKIWDKLHLIIVQSQCFCCKQLRNKCLSHAEMIAEHWQYWSEYSVCVNCN